jgi:hypothetical protein
MGYDNRPKTMRNNFNKDSFNNSKSQYKNKSYNKQSFGKDEEDIYSPKVYAKKEKKKSSFYDIPIPEYELDKQRMRNKRENDKKYKNKHR